MFDADARTDSFRCGTHLIREGDPADSVQQRCGKPDEVRRVNEYLGKPEAIGDKCYSGQVSLEQWVYRRGSNRPAILTIDAGKVNNIHFDPVSHVQEPDCR